MREEEVVVLVLVIVFLIFEVLSGWRQPGEKMGGWFFLGIVVSQS